MIKTDTIQITPELLALISEIDEFKGAWRALGTLAPERLKALRHIATIESIGSSTRIEGSKLSDREVERLLLFTGTVDEATLSQSYDILKEMNVWDPNEDRWNREAGDFTAKVLADNQAVERFVPFAEWATTQFVDAARRKLGRYEP
jgi:hypothetical protein